MTLKSGSLRWVEGGLHSLGGVIDATLGAPLQGDPMRVVEEAIEEGGGLDIVSEV